MLVHSFCWVDSVSHAVQACLRNVFVFSRHSGGGNAPGVNDKGRRSQRLLRNNRKIYTSYMTRLYYNLAVEK